MHYTAEVFCSH